MAFIIKIDKTENVQGVHGFHHHPKISNVNGE